MVLLSPVALALLALAVPVVLLYLLNRRPRERPVSSTFLWRRLAQPLNQQVRKRRARPNPLLLLTLLALAALVLALAQPAVLGARTLDGDLILVIDRSYAMQAHDVAPSRFAAAMHRARSLVDGLPPGRTATVIVMDAEPQVVTADNPDRAAVDGMLARLQPGTGSPNFPAALRVASSLAQGAATRIVVLTDRASGITRVPPGTRVPIEIDRLGVSTRDVGISSFAASASGGAVEAVLRLRNQSSSPVATTVRLFADGQLADVRPVQVAANGSLIQVWSHLPKTVHALQALIASPDDLTLDRSAWAIVPRGARRVLLVAGNDDFLRAALSLDPSIHLTVISRGQYDAARTAGEDLAVFDGFRPPSMPPVATLLVAPPPGRLGPLTLTAAAVPTGSFQPSRSPLLRYVDLSQVHLGMVRRAVFPSSLAPILRLGSLPVILDGTLEGRRTAVLLFDPLRSDWPLRTSFPILIHALTSHLAPPVVPPSLNLGQSVTIAPPYGVSDAAVTEPTGAVLRLRVPATLTPSLPGIYTVHVAGSTAAVAVNVIAPTLEATSGPAVLRFAGASAGMRQASPITADLTWPLVLAAALLLSAEWVLAARR
ncbi:MAG TPA: VWA domain-containing protein [Chloroflexota bacterium]|nr:VWA domain-containing protein [Chloroflexota bacterium]